jgi:hypothetical protein
VAIDELRTLPPTLPAEQAFKLLGCGRTSGYAAIRSGDFPVPVLKIGRVIRIPTRPLLELLGIRVPDDGGGDGP